ncbi:TetR/AcrR family transcriptional regulator [Neogemmobacter tilapiae]|uniref:TetR family transcriptional regulator n=1 Tax=Neogemmobacter tilapiae TaxID=875041 RepID=A0A918WGW0_9RHOB|nr:TetR/AcrR family transcriptional regulator [Gemmobacter tilapiae]GHC43136.1 TetR family transcriptional regulator [Gemmobacter tilapiae]
MTAAHSRKKNPEGIRRALLDHAARLAVEQGLHAVTVQAVSDAAGVTKGGLMHHFATKQALVDAMFAEHLEALGKVLADQMQADPERRGAFTRAYLRSVFELEPTEKGGPWASVYVAMLSDARLRAMWANWFSGQVQANSVTDSDPVLTIVRLAADGAWLADMSDIVLSNRAELLALLLAMTRG